MKQVTKLATVTVLTSENLYMSFLAKLGLEIKVSDDQCLLARLHDFQLWLMFPFDQCL